MIRSYVQLVWYISSAAPQRVTLEVEPDLDLDLDLDLYSELFGYSQLDRSETAIHN